MRTALWGAMFQDGAKERASDSTTRSIQERSQASPGRHAIWPVDARLTPGYERGRLKRTAEEKGQLRERIIPGGTPLAFPPQGARGSRHGAWAEPHVTAMATSGTSSQASSQVAQHQHMEEPPARVDPSPAYAIPAVRLYTLGHFRLLIGCEHAGHVGQDGWVDLADARAWGHGRAQELLLLLLLRRRPLTRAEAAATLWPATEASRRKQLLRNALWNLRRVLAQHASVLHADCGATTALLLHEASYLLSVQVNALQLSATATALTPHMDTQSASQSAAPSHIWCDALAFEAAAEQVRAAASLEERIELGQAALQPTTVGRSSRIARMPYTMPPGFWPIVHTFRRAGPTSRSISRLTGVVSANASGRSICCCRRSNMILARSRSSGAPCCS